MNIEMHSVTIRATIVPDDADNTEQFQKTFTQEDLAKAPGIITDIFSMAKRYIFMNTNNTPSTNAPSPHVDGRAGEGST